MGIETPVCVLGHSDALLDGLIPSAEEPFADKGLRETGASNGLRRPFDSPDDPAYGTPVGCLVAAGGEIPGGLSTRALEGDAQKRHFGDAREECGLQQEIAR